MHFKKWFKKDKMPTRKEMYELYGNDLNPNKNDIIVYMSASESSSIDDFKEKFENFQFSWEYPTYEINHPYEYGKWKFGTVNVRLHLLPERHIEEHGK